MLYWNIGKIINTHKSWENKFIENPSQDIKLDFPDVKGFEKNNREQSCHRDNFRSGVGGIVYSRISSAFE